MRTRDAMCRHRMMRAQAQTGTGDPTAIHNSPTVSHGNAGLELGQTCGQQRGQEHLTHLKAPCTVHFEILRCCMKINGENDVEVC